MFSVIASAVIGMAIFNTTAVIIDNVRIEFDCMVQIRQQSRQIGGNSEVGQETPQVTLEDFQNYADSIYLSGAEITPASTKQLFIDAIMASFTSMFGEVNTQVQDIAVQVGQTPEGWKYACKG